MEGWEGAFVDATCPDTLAPSYSTVAVREAGAVAADARYRKTQKYSHLSSSHCFETLGVFGKEARRFFTEVAQRMRLATCEQLAHLYLLQCMPVAVQRGNAASVIGCTGVRGEG